MNYEERYHGRVHNNLLNNNRYYNFKAKCSNIFYWKFLHGKVLEFGCGLGQNIFLHRNNCLGIDVSEFALGKCKEKGIKVSKDIKKIEDESFDGVLCCHVLEHLENPIEYIKEFYRVLKKDGILVVVLPYSKNRVIKNFKSDVAKHFFNWNFSSINELLNYVGFKIKLNKFNYACGYSKFYKFSFKLSIFLLKLIGIIKKRKEMIIVAKK